MHLILTQCFPPTLGGIETTMGALARALAERGGAVQVLADGGDTPFGRDAPPEHGYALTRFGGFKPLRQWLKGRAAAKIAAKGAQGVICDSWKSLEALPPLPCPVSCLAHGSEFPVGADPARTARIRRALAKADLIAANSAYTADLVRPHLGPKTRLRIAVTPISPPAQPDAAALRGFEALGRPLIVCLCRLEPRKGVDRLIEAVAELGTRHPGLTLRVGGDGPDRPRLEALARDKGLDPEAVFPGRVSEGEKSALLAAADVFAMPARREGASVEGYGLVYLEAGWFGVPSLAGQEGGAADAVDDGRTGLLCDGASLAAVTQALDRLLSDSDLRQRLGAAAQARAHAETWALRVDDFLPGGA